MNGLPVADLLLMAAALAGAGAVAGVIGGLFGVGGGTVLVPALFYAFSVLGVGGESNLHVAIGTSLLTIVATSWKSLATHRAHGAVDEKVLRTWTPWVAFGGLVGAAIAGVTSMEGLAIVYGACLLLVAAQMGLLPERFTLRPDLPTGWGRRGAGTLIGDAFSVLGVGGESNLHVAIGTSLLTIVATSWKSLATHRAHGAVDEKVLRTWTPWVAFGGLVGAAIAGVTSMEGLAIVYGACLLLVAAQMGLLPERFTLRSDLPTGWGRRGAGTVIGGLSAMMGVGGGSLGGMTMVLCGRPIHQAVATASGFGLAIGAAAALGFAVFGWGAEARPPLSLGYVNLPAAAIMGLLTALTAPIGARLAHRLDRGILKKAFAVYLLATAISVVVKAL